MSGTGLLIHEIERDLEACSCRWGERARGLVTPPVFKAAGGGVFVSVACVSASRWYARVSSLRAIAMVAIFFPRRFAMAV